MEEEENLEEASVDTEEENESKMGFCGCFCIPITWLKMLATEMHWSFVLGVVVVYGISQGLGGALSRVGTEYYMKDVQKVQPSEAQVYGGITSIPWLVKPLWGLLTDVVPVFGYRRRPYFILAGKCHIMRLSFTSKAIREFSIIESPCMFIFCLRSVNFRFRFFLFLMNENFFA